MGELNEVSGEEFFSSRSNFFEDSGEFLKGMSRIFMGRGYLVLESRRKLRFYVFGDDVIRRLLFWDSLLMSI